MTKIRKGDTFTFKPEWSQPGDEKYTFMAIEDESAGRFEYKALGGPPMAFHPINMARLDWVESVTGNMMAAIEQCGGAAAVLKA